MKRRISRLWGTLTISGRAKCRGSLNNEPEICEAKGGLVPGSAAMELAYSKISPLRDPLVGKVIERPCLVYIIYTILARVFPRSSPDLVCSRGSF